MSTILPGTAPSRTRTLTGTIPSTTAMRTFRTSIIGTATDLLRGLAFASLALVAHAAPYVPTDDATVIERLPVRPGDPIARELRQLRAELTANPRRRDTAVRLAERYFELASSEGDPRYVGYGPGALQPWGGPARPTAGRSREARDPQAIQPRFLRRNAGPRNGDARGPQERTRLVLARRDPHGAGRLREGAGRLLGSAGARIRALRCRLHSLPRWHHG